MTEQINLSKVTEEDQINASKSKILMQELVISPIEENEKNMNKTS